MCELFGLTGPDELTVNEYLKTFYPWRTPLSLCQSLTEGTKKLKCASQMPLLESERAPKSIGALGENV